MFMLNSLLVRAAIKNKVKLLKFVIKMGADIDKKVYGFTPVECACIYQSDQAIKILVESGCRLNYRGSIICHVFAEWNRYHILKDMVKNGLNVNMRDCNGRTGLHWAVEKGSVESAAVLLESGADVNVTDKDDMTPLLMACIDGDYEIAAALLKHGADVNCRDGDGNTPLFHAKARQRRNIQKLLLKYGAVD